MHALEVLSASWASAWRSLEVRPDVMHLDARRHDQLANCQRRQIERGGLFPPAGPSLLAYCAGSLSWPRRPEQRPGVSLDVSWRSAAWTSAWTSASAGRQLDVSWDVSWRSGGGQTGHGGHLEVSWTSAGRQLGCQLDVSCSWTSTLTSAWVSDWRSSACRLISLDPEVSHSGRQLGRQLTGRHLDRRRGSRGRSRWRLAWTSALTSVEVSWTVVSWR